jgi:hypothetical protein
MRTAPGYRRDHLRALGQRIEIDAKEVRIMGLKSELLRTLVAASGAKTAGFGVPSFAPKWLPRAGPTASHQIKNLKWRTTISARIEPKKHFARVANLEEHRIEWPADPQLRSSATGLSAVNGADREGHLLSVCQSTRCSQGPSCVGEAGMTARERFTGQVLAVMREAERQCAGALTAARRAFATFPPFTVAEIHPSMSQNSPSDGGRKPAHARKPPKPRWRWFCSPG